MLESPPMQASDVSTRGARIRFVSSDLPTSAPPDGSPLVFLHDALASHASFLGAMEHLRRSVRVIAPDLPGFGDSEKPDPQRYAYGYDAFADSIADLVAALGLGRVHVCGHGMGGGVALALAARHPALVNKLVLVDAFVYPAAEHVLDRMGRVPVLGRLLWSQLVGRAVFRSYVEATSYAGTRALPAGRLDAFYDAFNAPAARQAAHATLVAKEDTRSIVARLPRVQAPTLVVWGRSDEVAPVEHGRRLARALRGRIEVLECGRCPPDEEPEAFAAMVASFLQQTPERRPPSSRSLPHVP
ncbi:MAG: putative hydrolase [Labilithrix sp.]|nr:putative hydrolase [Labilithrix sp.]